MVRVKPVSLWLLCKNPTTTPLHPNADLGSLNFQGSYVFCSLNNGQTCCFERVLIFSLCSLWLLSFLYQIFKHLIMYFSVFECNSRCRCDSRCRNRVVQHGLTLRLQVFKTDSRLVFIICYFTSLGALCSDLCIDLCCFIRNIVNCYPQVLLRMFEVTLNFIIL